MRKKIKNKKPKPKYILYIERRNEYQVLGFVEISDLVDYAKLVQKYKPTFETIAFEWNEDHELRDLCYTIIDNFNSFELNAKLSGYCKPKKNKKK